MKEKLLDILTEIDSCAKAIKGTGISAAARVHCIRDGKEDTYWFTNRFYASYELNEIADYGHFVPKNSDVAVKLQTIDVGTSFEYSRRNSIKQMQKHRIELENRTNFINHTIAIAGDSLLYQFRNIGDFLDALRQNWDDIIEVENKIAELNQTIDELKKQKDTSHQRSQITRSIKEYQHEYRILTQQQEDLKNITIYIRKQGEMRYSLIVDTIQTRIKTQNLFDGKTIIIDGGPGTGKSTTMIHRLAYLTDIYAIDEDEQNSLMRYKLSSFQRKQLRGAIKNQRDWLFFSPSQLLKEYLADAMRKEGLTNTSQKVWNWKDYCRLILQSDYGLLGEAGSNAPFTNCNLTGVLFPQESKIIEAFTSFYLQQFKDIKKQLPEQFLQDKNYSWVEIAKIIKQKFEGSENFSLGRFISLFNYLETTYAEECKKLLRLNNDDIRTLAENICDLLEKNKPIKSDMEDLLELTMDSDWIEESDELSDDRAAETNDAGSESVSPSVGPSKEEKKEDNKLFVEIQKWVKAYCNHMANNEYKISDEHQLMCDLLCPLLGNSYDAQLQKISELVIFEQFAQYTRGVKAIMLNGLPARYKKFRTYLSKVKYEGCDLRLLRDIMQRKQGKELHHQEQSLLLGFINTLVKQIKSSNSATIKHKYIEAYEENCRPIIGIDEATDFSACDIYAMQSLLTRDYFSLTLCGDMMQRMTPYGIKSWSELNGIVSDPMVVEMKTSYRQSRKLLEVARNIYEDTLGETPNYKAFLKSRKVPAPLVFIEKSETLKIEWISTRITEVFRAYGETLPSIAIFVNDKGYIPRFIDILQNTEFFLKNSVKVMDGTQRIPRMAESHICVYPIDVVKGMEFDVVFFHNIDNSSEDTELLKRYIYVGVSRAAFFLGITLSEQNREISKYFETNKDWFKI